MAVDTVDDLRVGTPAFVDIGQEQPEPAPFQTSSAAAPDELAGTTGDALAEADIYNLRTAVSTRPQSCCRTPSMTSRSAVIYV